MNIGIFKEDFNPITKLHIEICKKAIEKHNLDKIILIPLLCDEQSNKEHIYSMIKLSIMGNDKLELVDDNIVFDEDYIKQEYSKDNVIYIYASEYGFENAITSRFIRILKKLDLSFKDYLYQDVYDYIQKNNLYPQDIYYEFITKVLPEKRRIHTYGVISLAIKYANILKFDDQKAEIAALLHDNAKYLNYNDYPNFTCPEGVPGPVIHQFLGEYIARNVLNVKDEEVLLAIKYHTTGRVGMTTLEKIIYLADLLEPSRTFNGVDNLRNAVDKNFEKGFARCVVELYNFISKDSNFVYYLTKELAEHYMEEKYDIK